ncbi:RNA polymerase sigma factor [Demequina sp. NBRC 110056]|uniref:RNA polymerase sigma factor n=1 Tax=Demequina sp. NBRC 110056 TaxID=1570345 RepID=UPI00135629C1|nr:sigma-70 family RNA polymerase sigma factor [Demequina sp. NBRC 110056]
MGTQEDVLVEVIDRAAGRLGAYAYILTGSQSEGEELVQAAIVKVFSRRTRLGTVEQAEAYVRRTMRTVHIDRVRRETTWRRLVPRLAPRQTASDSADQLAMRDELARALDTLPRQRRTAVVLRFYDDLSYQEIADAMGVSLGAVKRYLSDALAALGDVLGADAEIASVGPSDGRRL